MALREIPETKRPPVDETKYGEGPSWTYSGNPASSVKDAVRFEIQDTNANAQLLQDAEIVYAISQEAPNTPPSEGEVLSASARCMEVLQRLFAAQADTEIGSLKETYSKQAEVYAKRASELRKRAQGMHAPWAGGLSESEKQVREENTDRVPPLFKKGQFSSPYAGNESGAPLRPGEGEGSA
jgi:hypothetical protein